MKTPPSNPEFTRFTAAVKDILKVSPSVMENREAAKKESGKRLPKGSACLDSDVSELLRASFAKP